MREENIGMRCADEGAGQRDKTPAQAMTALVRNTMRENVFIKFRPKTEMSV